MPTIATDDIQYNRALAAAKAFARITGQERYIVWDPTDEESRFYPYSVATEEQLETYYASGADPIATVLPKGGVE